MTTIEDVIKSLQGINHSEVARRAGFTRSYINAIAQGVRVNPTYSSMMKIIEAVRSMNEEDK